MRMVDDQWKLEFELNRSIKLNSEGDEDEETKEDEEDENTLYDKSKFVLEVIESNDGKRYLTFKKQSGSFMVAREIWTLIQENVMLLA